MVQVQVLRYLILMYRRKPEEIIKFTEHCHETYKDRFSLG